MPCLFLTKHRRRRSRFSITLARVSESDELLVIGECLRIKEQSHTGPRKPETQFDVFKSSRLEILVENTMAAKKVGLQADIARIKITIVDLRTSLKISERKENLGTVPFHEWRRLQGRRPSYEA